MTIRNAAKTLKTLRARHSAVRGKVIDPGKFQLPDLELMREQARMLSPHYQISSVLSEISDLGQLGDEGVAPPSAALSTSIQVEEASLLADSELLLQQAMLFGPVYQISSLLAGRNEKNA